MLHGYRLFTLTHRDASLAQLEPYVLSDEARRGALERLRDELGWQEVFYLATCNRVLFFFYQETRDAATAADLMRVLGVPAGAAEPRYLEGEMAVMHLYDVAASVDSMVVGEREILRQLRLAYLACHEVGLCGDHLRLVMQSAVAAAKQVYHETRIGQKPVSVVSLAAQRIRQQRLDAASARVVLVGAGQTNFLASKFLRKQGFRHVLVANRTRARAERLAASYPAGEACTLAELPTRGAAFGFDLIVVATASAEPVVDEAAFTALLGDEDAAGKVVVDLSIPHDIAADVVEAHDFTYVEIEDLRRLADDNLAFRAAEVREARKLIGQQLMAFQASVQQRRVELALREVPAAVKAVRRRAMTEVFARELEDLDEEARELVGRMMRYMEKKCIGIPMRAAREAVVAPDAHDGSSAGSSDAKTVGASATGGTRVEPRAADGVLAKARA